MTEVQDARHQRAKRMRRIARILGLFWACCWTLTMAGVYLFIWAFANFDYPTPVPREYCLGVALLSTLPWVGAAVSWRWEAVGGVLFVLQSLVPFMFVGLYSPGIGVLCVFLAVGWPLAVGVLFLVSWWTSRNPKVADNTE